MYSSVIARNSGGTARKKNKVSQLAQETFEAFQPFVNIFDPGLKLDDGRVIHTITKEDWELNRRHKAGEKPCYEDGTPFNPYLDIIRDIYKPIHVHRHIEDDQISYYTSGRRGLGLLYLDIDAHEEWQTDQVQAREIIERFFEFGYFRNSPRGENGYLKLRYSSIDEFNDIANRLEKTLQRLFLHYGILCDFEIKGTITHGDKSGRLAKLPFASRYGPRLLHRKEWGWWEWELLETTEDWCWTRLEQFKNKPTVDVRCVDRLSQQIEERIDEEQVARCATIKAKLREECQRKEQESVRLSGVTHVASQHADRGVKDAPVRHNLGATPVSAMSTASSTKRHQTTSQTGSCEGNAFARNQKGLLPFTRQFFKRHQRFPEVDDALKHLQENGLFSGQWEDNHSHRARRVGDILKHISRTFDPEQLGSGESKPLSLSVDKFSWWVRQRFGTSMSGTVSDLRSFDPVSMSAPVKKVTVPAEFIKTFLVVADVCVNQDPLDNKAVPTNRFKKLWPMVKGGAAWNQGYYQIVRDKLDRMGVIQIVDREQKTGKAWRWESGSCFPAASWKEEQQQLKEKAKASRSGTEEPLPDVSHTRREKEHNTLYETNNRILELQASQQAVRPPP